MAINDVTASVFPGNNVQRLGDVVALAPKGGNQLSVRNTNFSFVKDVASPDLALDRRFDQIHYYFGTNNTYIINGSGGGISSISMFVPLGFSVNIANPTTTPAINLTTSLSGIIKGNGTGFVGATVNVDYLPPFSSQTSNTFFAAPDGSNGLPAFRPISSNDIPSFDASKITTGFISSSRGGLGFDVSSVPSGQILVGNGSGVSARSILPGTNINISNNISGITINAIVPSGVYAITATSGIAGGTITGSGIFTLAPIPSGTILANVGAASGIPIGSTLSSVLDLLSNVQGSTIYRGATQWSVLPPGASGQYYQALGPNANPQWATPRTLPSLLNSASGINAKNIGSTNIYNVPAGRTAEITNAIVKITSSSGITFGATAGIGINGSDIFAPNTMNLLLSQPSTFGFILAGMSTMAMAGSGVNFNIVNPASGAAQTLAVDLIGYLL